MVKVISFIILFCHSFICYLCVFPVEGTVNSQLNENRFELWSIGSNNLPIPHETIRFSWTKLVAIPFHSKRHIAKIKAVIEPNNEKYIENMYLYRCTSLQTHKDYDEQVQWIAKSIITDNENKKHLCYKLLAIWSQEDHSNKTLLSLPKSIGIPIGDNENEKYLLLEMNYENSNSNSGLSDSSGFKLYIDKQNREFDADIVAVGSVPDYRFFIPPKLEEWTVSANCYKECLQNKISAEGIRPLSVLYRGRHKSLKDLNIEISKSNKVSTTLLTSANKITETHDQNELKLENSDQISIKCRFNSMKQNKTVLGGFSHDRAQCVAWILYYPKVENFDACLSSFSLSTIMSIIGAEGLEEKWRTDDHFDILITHPKTNQVERLEDYLINKTDWDYKRVNRAKYAALFGKQIAQCNWKRSIFDEII